MSGAEIVSLPVHCDGPDCGGPLSCSCTCSLCKACTHDGARTYIRAIPNGGHCHLLVGTAVLPEIEKVEWCNDCGTLLWGGNHVLKPGGRFA